MADKAKFNMEEGISQLKKGGAVRGTLPCQDSVGEKCAQSPPY